MRHGEEFTPVTQCPLTLLASAWSCNGVSPWVGLPRFLCQEHAACESFDMQFFIEVPVSAVDSEVVEHFTLVVIVALRY
eukprot:2787792-Rhodomonas_salina.3